MQDSMDDRRNSLKNHPCAPSKIVYHGDTEDTELLVSTESSP
jgi:hypothetical protein